MGISGKKAATTQTALLLKKLSLYCEKRDVAYGIWSIGMNQSLDTHSAGTAAKVKNKNQQNQMRKARLQPQTVANNEKYPYFSFGNLIPQDCGAWVGVRNKGN